MRFLLLFLLLTTCSLYAQEAWEPVTLATRDGREMTGEFLNTSIVPPSRALQFRSSATATPVSIEFERLSSLRTSAGFYRVDEVLLNVSSRNHSSLVPRSNKTEQTVTVIAFRTVDGPLDLYEYTDELERPFFFREQRRRTTERA